MALRPAARVVLTENGLEMLLECEKEEDLSPTEVATFDSALRLFFTNSEVKEMNGKKLSGVGQPVKKVLAWHKG
ncbi:uncharacterized protein Z518_04089 [Rhinocladiella mackenziei CBS 650.93]|uniref:Uncharacterized protein n=1 Tax=Rhinocladiella mackenziei CBS 650.93 TaxID=1442369 RepID=A0A0D2JAH3_9EURO|nr:uncharacterized protein Z518_04089 [Rhinocladiella mackenziei CBS 650.93]KIX06115.1 hypothetical protein Z518_04089 [Rhinocladiella mackenziei CBS 650.93]